MPTDRKVHDLYTHSSRRNIYVACEDLEHVWDEDDVILFDRMWREGCTLPVIADHFNRDPDEVLILLIDRANKDKLTPTAVISRGSENLWCRISTKELNKAVNDERSSIVQRGQALAELERRKAVTR